MRYITLILAAIITISACSDTERSAFSDIGAPGWRYGDTITFIPSDTAECAAGNIAVAVRHTNGYEYSNLWLELTYSSPDTIATDTFNIVLADDFGHWRGKGVGIGYQMVDTLLRNVIIDTSAPIYLRHVMRTDTLRDIQQIGIIFTPK